MRFAFAALVLAAVGCRVAPPLVMPELAHARVTADFETYDLRRVGIMPFVGKGLSEERARELQVSFFQELAAATPYEYVLLAPADVAEIESSEPYRRGWYRPRTIIRISRRYNLDAILFGSVVHERTFPPLSLSLQSEMVAAETGLVLWSSAIDIDAADSRVVDGLRLFYGPEGDGSSDAPTWRLALLSPERFARFAAFQVASLL